MVGVKDWNPRFVAYARAHQRSPGDQLAQDRVDWPGGVMCGFVLWIRAAWQTFEPDSERRRWVACCPERSQAFDQWLAQRAEEGCVVFDQ